MTCKACAERDKEINLLRAVISSYRAMTSGLMRILYESKHDPKSLKYLK